MPKKLCPFLSTSGCFHLLTFVCSLRPVLASSTAWTSTSWGNISPLAGRESCFLGRKLTSLLAILSATSSALALLNASLIHPQLSPPSCASHKHSYSWLPLPSPPLPHLFPLQQARQEALVPSSETRKGSLGCSAPGDPAWLQGWASLCKFSSPTQEPLALCPLCLWLWQVSPGPWGISGHGLTMHCHREDLAQSLCALGPQMSNTSQFTLILVIFLKGGWKVLTGPNIINLFS